MIQRWLMSYYPVTCYTLLLFLIHCIIHKCNLGWEKLNGWLTFIEWMSWIHISLTAGDIIVLATLLSIVYLFALAGWSWSQQLRDCVRLWSRVCTGYTHLIRALWPLRFQLMLIIWSLSRSDNDTRMSCSDGFSWSMGSSMNCLWYGTLEEID